MRSLKSNYLRVNSTRLISVFIVFSLFKSCIVPFTPESDEFEELLVVEGLITDQHEVCTIKLSKSFPLWKAPEIKPTPLKGSKVWISDDFGQIHNLKETIAGTFITDSASFQGTIGRKYTLHIKTNDSFGNLNYESVPMEMKPVPKIDSIYYEKTVSTIWNQTVEGCNIYLDTYDPTNNCNFFRWKFSETWEFHLPNYAIDKICWTTDYSNGIFIKNTSILSEDRVIRYPLISITNPNDKLSGKYSILVNQYSLNEDEYLYWEKLKKTSEQGGGLYDLIPTFIPNNINCIEDPSKKVLGYFSVSAVSSKRIFIKDTFSGLNDYTYYNCITDTLYRRGNLWLYDTISFPPTVAVEGSYWIITDNSDKKPPNRIITTKRECVFCSLRGANIKPAYWDDDNK